MVIGTGDRCAALQSHLARRVAARRRTEEPRPRLAPVLVDLQGLAGKLASVAVLEELVTDALRAHGGVEDEALIWLRLGNRPRKVRWGHGGLNDDALVRRLLARGSFLVLLRGAAGLSAADLRIIQQFSERYRRGNHFVLAVEKEAGRETVEAALADWTAIDLDREASIHAAAVAR
jgi:hypothetical protein